MSNKSRLIAIIIIVSNLYSQKHVIYDTTSHVGTDRILRSYITAGVGRTANYLNHCGRIIYFRSCENILINTRGNIKFEIDYVQLLS